MSYEEVGDEVMGRYDLDVADFDVTDLEEIEE